MEGIGFDLTGPSPAISAGVYEPCESWNGVWQHVVGADTIYHCLTAEKRIVDAVEYCLVTDMTSQKTFKSDTLTLWPLSSAPTGITIHEIQQPDLMGTLQWRAQNMQPEWIRWTLGDPSNAKLYMWDRIRTYGSRISTASAKQQNEFMSRVKPSGIRWILQSMDGFNSWYLGQAPASDLKFQTCPYDREVSFRYFGQPNWQKDDKYTVHFFSAQGVIRYRQLQSSRFLLSISTTHILCTLQGVIRYRQLQSSRFFKSEQLFCQLD